MIIFKEFTFDAAHSLPNVPEGHKCKTIHGHTYRMKVIIKGAIDPQLGWVMDFLDIKRVVKPVIDQIDHKYMNELEGLENPTCETVVKWLWNRIKPDLPLLREIELNETPTSGAVYSGGDRL